MANVEKTAAQIALEESFGKITEKEEGSQYRWGGEDLNAEVKLVSEEDLAEVQDLMEKYRLYKAEEARRDPSLVAEMDELTLRAEIGKNAITGGEKKTPTEQAQAYLLIVEMLNESEPGSEFATRAQFDENDGRRALEEMRVQMFENFTGRNLGEGHAKKSEWDMYGEKPLLFFNRQKALRELSVMNADELHAYKLAQLEAHKEEFSVEKELAQSEIDRRRNAAMRACESIIEMEPDQSQHEAIREKIRETFESAPDDFAIENLLMSLDAKLVGRGSEVSELYEKEVEKEHPSTIDLMVEKYAAADIDAEQNIISERIKAQKQAEQLAADAEEAEAQALLQAEADEAQARYEATVDSVAESVTGEPKEYIARLEKMYDDETDPDNKKELERMLKFARQGYEIVYGDCAERLLHMETNTVEAAADMLDYLSTDELAEELALSYGIEEDDPMIRRAMVNTEISTQSKLSLSKRIAKMFEITATRPVSIVESQKDKAARLNEEKANKKEERGWNRQDEVEKMKEERAERIAQIQEARKQREEEARLNRELRKSKKTAKINSKYGRNRGNNQQQSRPNNQNSRNQNRR